MQTENQIAVLEDRPLESLGDIQSISDYLHMFGPDLIKRLNSEYIPVHHPGTDSPLEVLEEIKRPLFNAQAHVVTALIKGFQKHKRLFLIGGMGTGKTAISISTFFSLIREMLKGTGRVIYMVPNHLLKKTKREISILLDKDLYEARYLKSYQDVIQLRDSGIMNSPPTKIEVYIIARDTCKLGYMYEPVAKWVDRTYEKHVGHGEQKESFMKTSFKGWVCPDCGGQLMKKEEGDAVPLEYDDFYNKHGKPARRKYNLSCSNQLRLYKNADPDKDEYRECGARLWSAKNKNKMNIAGERVKVSGAAPRKVSPADLFKRYFKRKFDLTIGDECHELTGGSAQAHAFHVLMGCAKNTVAMTGTLMNGYASNLFELIFRMYPNRMKHMGFMWGDVGKWIDLYGVREKTMKIKKNVELNSSSNGSSVKVSTKELPAAAPQLYTDILSDVSCFIQMSDMFEVLPTLDQGPMFVDMEGERRFVNNVTKIHKRPGSRRRLKKGMRLVAPSWYLQNNLDIISNKLRRAVEKELAVGQSVLLGSLVNTLLSYPDVPFNFKGVYHPDTGEEIVSPLYRLSDRVIYPKEQQLLKFVKSRIRAGRKVGIYATYTGKLGTLQRLQLLLEEQNIKTAVLESNVEGPEREEWIAQKEREGIQVLLTNPILVSTGLDLLGFPSLFFYQTGHRLTIVRQASGRHWRIGQKNACETVYSGYKGSMQELAINLMATKMNAALALEGQFSEDGLSALTDSSGGGSLANELAKRFIGNKIDGVESAESIWGKMTIDATQFATQIESATVGVVEVVVEENFNSELLPVSNRYHGKTLEDAILSWANDHIPSDLVPRFTKQIEFVSQHVLCGVEGLSYSRASLVGEMELVWDPSAIRGDDTAFRRWAFNLTNMPVQVRGGTDEWTPSVVIEGKKGKTKRKKIYNVSEGQIAFIL
ncbi:MULTISPECIES: helicase-related protein [Paenibacillus]|uniref:helicase-related protein n=1 Tax=Paenibacillus TaxID=44249 RepID=UPI0004184C3B|nr:MULTISPECIES: helicase-related protein [Paenibacillus]KGP77686.1 hypothetical protein P364_0131925 [Paenibacillus sp. MAEPY2]KGP78695.1 hypothetical protein P363_0131995 [Paenibacillus sp. MAEPY1]OZQ61312.1 hypothetical protein CA599_28410 [Paenibacillus taichungensis]